MAFAAIAKLLAAAAVGYLIYALVARAVRLLAGGDGWFAVELLHAARPPARLLFPLLALVFALPAVTELGPVGVSVARHGISIGLIAAFTWLAVALIDVAAGLVLRPHDIAATDNLQARQIHTQTVVLRRIATSAAIVFGAAAVLMTFPSIRQIGASLLVSAGVAGLAVGLAARPVLENMFAGLQLALTQPIRVDDVVIVEGEWGRIEEITATYVVVRIWDQRRLIVPLAYFISQPFQNWTRTTADILGSIFLYVDYAVPVAALREELQRLCVGSSLWDGKVCNIQVTDTTERTMQLRALVSAADSGSAWELRVHVREQLIEFLQRRYPGSLPRARISLERADGG